MKKQPHHGPKELRLLALLTDAQQLLADALNSMASKPVEAETTYLMWAAVSVNRAAEGYLWLRKAGRVAASKLLVRPALEAIFWAIAVITKPGFLFRKLYTELEEDRKMFPNNASVLVARKQTLEAMKRAAMKVRPSYPLECKTVRVRDAADAAGLSKVYDGAYRTYCKFTHGAIQAVQGHLDGATDETDTAVVVWCVLTMLDYMRKHTPAQVPELEPFWKKLEAAAPPADEAASGKAGPGIDRTT
jgi:hypothetical protein